jgi:hypothetical protein
LKSVKLWASSPHSRSVNPGTQLTMRTFHIGGTARLEESSKHEARQDGTVKYLDLQTVKSRKGERIAMNRNGSLIIIDDRGREAARYRSFTAPTSSSRTALA